MKLSLGNLPQTLSEEGLAELFRDHAPISHIVIKKDKNTKKSLGYGSVEVEDHKADALILAFHGKELEGKTLAVVKQEDLAKGLQTTGKQKGNPLPAKGNQFGRTNSPGGGGSTSVQRRGGNRGS